MTSQVDSLQNLPISAYRDGSEYDIEEQADWDCLATQMDDWIEKKANAKSFTREEMERFCELWYTEKVHPGWIDYCLNCVNERFSNDCLWK